MVQRFVLICLVTMAATVVVAEEADEEEVASVVEEMVGIEVVGVVVMVEEEAMTLGQDTEASAPMGQVEEEVDHDMEVMATTPDHLMEVAAVMITGVQGIEADPQLVTEMAAAGKLHHDHHHQARFEERSIGLFMYTYFVTCIIGQFPCSASSSFNLLCIVTVSYSSLVLVL